MHIKFKFTIFTFVFRIFEYMPQRAAKSLGVLDWYVSLAFRTILQSLERNYIAILFFGKGGVSVCLRVTRKF